MTISKRILGLILFLLTGAVLGAGLVVMTGFIILYFKIATWWVICGTTISGCIIVAAYILGDNK